MKKKLRIGLNLGLVVLLLLGFLVEAPNINPLYPSGAFIWCAVITAFIVINFLLGLGGIQVSQDPVTGRPKLDVGKLQGFAKKSLYVIITLWVLYFLVGLASSPIVNYKAYRDQLGANEQQQDFTQDIQPMALDKLPIVDQDLARRLADKKLGEKTSLGSQVKLGDPVIQQVNGELVWAVPLYHSGFFKWLNNMSGTPGYIMVSATNMQDVEYVDGYKIKYQPDNYLLDDLERHMRIFGAAFDGLSDPSFEIDDQGRPFWVVTTYKNNWLFALPEATGAITVDAATGQMERYTMENIPSWVDRVQPEDFIIRQINNQGEYVHGFLNFSNKDKMKSSEGHIIVYNEGRCYLFTGLTSVGQDESAVGFIMVDMVTKESKIYYMSGATESAAQQSAQGKVQQYGYIASFPMILNLDGRATYFMPLKDDSGLIKQYAFVPVSDYTIVGVGETISQAKQNYEAALRGSSSGAITSGGEEKEITGTVYRIGTEEVGSSTNYKLILQESKDKIFVLSHDLSHQLALTRDGDQVTITYQDNGSNVLTGTKFTNNSLGQSDLPTPEPEGNDAQATEE